MGRKFRSGAAPEQVMLMPADPREWLPPGHLAWKVIELAAGMDLSRFGAAYRGDGQGGRPYHPQVMAALLLYCYCRGRRSSREIEMATFDDAGARIICGGLHPGHSAVAEFVRGNLDAVLALLPESVRACAREGLVAVEVAAGDGTKLKANAAMASNVTAAQLDAQIAELEAVIDAEFREWAQDMLDGEAPAGGPRHGDGPGGSAGSAAGSKPAGEKPARAEQALARRKAARAQLRARQEDKRREELLPKIAELSARAEKKEAAVRTWEARAAARISERARRTAAGERIGGTRPVAGVSQDREVRRARQALAKVRAACEAARAEAAAPAGGPDAKISTAGPSSRVMPLKKDIPGA